MKIFITTILLVMFIGLIGCEGRSHLRGSVEPSKDEKTYFSVVEDNGESCYPIFLDGKEWKHKLGEIAEVQAGEHKINACSEMGFTIPEGTLFKFDYWGP